MVVPSRFQRSQQRVDDALGLGGGEVGVEGQPHRVVADVLVGRAGQVAGAAASPVEAEARCVSGIARSLPHACLPDVTVEWVPRRSGYGARNGTRALLT